MPDRKDYRFSFGNNALTGRYFHPEKNHRAHALPRLMQQTLPAGPNSAAPEQPREGRHGRRIEECRARENGQQHDTRDTGVIMAIPRGKTVIANENEKGETAMDEKSAYRQKVEARLDQWRADIDKLQAKAVEASADARLEYHKQIDELREKQHKAQAKLKELNEASGDAWKDFKAGVEKAWDDLGDAVKKATERFS
jgi:ElaB/YqjD/DUF883 family membrane-anchored ribosome-binding protein